MKLSAHQDSVSGLLSGSSRGFSIPDFQRNYSWGETQISQFWSDLNSVIENGTGDHFMGPIVLLESQNDRKPVIDGQQRFTTLVILASVIRDYLINDLGNPSIDIDGNTIYVAQKLRPLLFLTDLRTPTLESNYQIRSIFEQYIVKSPLNTERRNFDDPQNLLTNVDRRLSKNLESCQKSLKNQFTKWIEVKPKNQDFRIEEISKLIDSIFENIQFLTIEVGSEEDAFTIFETLNDRGLKLSPGDLIKSYLLRKIIEQNPYLNRVDITNKWDQILANLEDYDISSFLRHFLLTRYSTPVQKSSIFSLIKKKVDDSSLRDSSSAKNELDEIMVSSIYYGQLLGSSNSSIDNAEVERRLNLLSLVGDSYRIFLLRVMQLGFIDDALIYAIATVEKLSLRWVVTGQNAQELEKLFQNSARELIQGDIESFKSVCDALVLKAPTDDLVVSAFKNGTSRDTKLQAYVMRSICYGITGSDVTTDKKDVSVEHTAPQKPDDSLWYEKVALAEVTGDGKNYSDYVYSWGNITILEQKLNSSIGNGKWLLKKYGNEKYKGYSASSIEVTKQLLAIEDWNAEIIELRSDWIAEQAVKYWNRRGGSDPQPSLTPFALKSLF